MLKRFLRNIFSGEAVANSNNEALAALHNNPAVRTKEEMDKMPPDSGTSTIKLKSGQVKTLMYFDIDGIENPVLTQWNYSVGDIVRCGDVLCEIETNLYTMEYESLYEGELIWCCEGKNPLVSGTEICKIKGIDN